ncbi:MAG: hypothetical protein V2B18_23985, partial [Pseudomonadota bacterium]
WRRQCSEGYLPSERSDLSRFYDPYCRNGYCRLHPQGCGVILGACSLIARIAAALPGPETDVPTGLYLPSGFDNA